VAGSTTDLLRNNRATAASLERSVRWDDILAHGGWERRFELPWMIRLGDAGVPVTWVWCLAAYVALALAVALIWLRPWQQRRRAAYNGADTSGPVVHA
jgi:hypothetical protein